MKTLCIGLALVAGLLTRGAWAGPACVGDCDGDGAVTVDEIVIGSNVALGSAAVTECSAMDFSGDSVITVDEIVAAIANVLNGCSESVFVGSYTGLVLLGPVHEGQISLVAEAGTQLSGALTISASAAAGGAGGIPFPAEAVVPLSGGYVGATGSFQVIGSFFDANEVERPVLVRGFLPQPGATTSVSVRVFEEVFSGMLRNDNEVSEPTPTATVSP